MIDLQDVEREKPLAAMGAIGNFPPVPLGMGELTGERQATIVVHGWSQAGRLYGLCESKRQTLIDWINQEPVNTSQ